MSDPSTTTTTTTPTAPVVTLGQPLPVALEEPPALFGLACTRSEGAVAVGGLSQDLAYGAAALRACWPEKRGWPTKHRPRAWRPGVDINVYGFEIFEELSAVAGRGKAVSRKELRDACYAALNWTLGCLLSEEEVTEAQDFSEAPGEE